MVRSTASASVVTDVETRLFVPVLAANSIPAWIVELISEESVKAAAASAPSTAAMTPAEGTTPRRVNCSRSRCRARLSRTPIVPTGQLNCSAACWCVSPSRSQRTTGMRYLSATAPPQNESPRTPHGGSRETQLLPGRQWVLCRSFRPAGVTRRRLRTSAFSPPAPCEQPRRAASAPVAPADGSSRPPPGS